jgi:L-ascorbate metabolism protein UlaG (beta-lactamase superfamily)
MKTISFPFITFLLIFSSCISISKSTFREPVPKVIEVSACKISSTGAVFLKMFGFIKIDFMPASVKIDYDQIVIFCDPLVVEDTMKADYIFITHNHLDHFSKTDINKLLKPTTVIIAPKTVLKKYKHISNHAAKVGSIYNLDEIQCEVVESYNTNSNIHKKGDKCVGFVITCDTTRIYIAGDTDFIPEMKDLEEITVAIIPIGEGKTAMNPESAGQAVNLINPKIAIPVHYELNQNRENDFVKNVNNPVVIKLFHDKND